MVIEPDGTEREVEVEWSIEGIRAAVGGDFRIVAEHDGCHVIEIENTSGTEINRAASEKLGRALHGRILIIKEKR